MDELVYVSDMDSHDLIYMNKKALRTYGFHSLEDIVGKKCHEALRHCPALCTMCNNHELRPRHFREWQHYNPILERQIIIKDTMINEDGKSLLSMHHAP